MGTGIPDLLQFSAEALVTGCKSVWWTPKTPSPLLCTLLETTSPQEMLDIPSIPSRSRSQYPSTRGSSPHWGERLCLHVPPAVGIHDPTSLDRYSYMSRPLPCSPRLSPGFPLGTTPTLLGLWGREATEAGRPWVSLRTSGRGIRDMNVPWGSKLGAERQVLGICSQFGKPWKETMKTEASF